MTNDDNQKIGWLLFASLVVAGVMIGLILFAFDRFTAPPQAPPPECSELLAEQCGPGQDCIDGTCQETPDRRRACESGEVCSIDCACGFPRSCVENRCLIPMPASAASTCDERAQQLIARLDARYKSCLQEAKKDPLSCSSDEFEKFLIENADFGDALTRYGEALLLVFPTSKPLFDSEQRDSWPDDPTLQHYLGYLKEREPRFLEASRIVLMGRATRSPNAQQDYFFARARVTFAQGLLTDLGNKLSAGVLTRKLMMFAVGADNRLDLEYLKDHETIRVIGWRENEEREIGEALAKLRGGGKVAQKVRERLEEVINRSVILVAVPCPLPEGAP